MELNGFQRVEMNIGKVDYICTLSIFVHFTVTADKAKLTTSHDCSFMDVSI